LDGSEPIEFAPTEEIGRITRNEKAVDFYIEHIAGAVGDLSGIKIAVDCANGASYYTARRVFEKANAEATFLNCEPDGTNVNRECGSLYTAGLGKYVKENGFDIGVAFDGDADRCLAVDENGELIDGDMFMAILAERFAKEGRLEKNIFIPTIMSNMGLFKFAEEHGMSCYPTKVGDRYVLESLLKLGASLGGEQSGHIIIPEYMTTGDGELSALMLIESMKLSGKRASELKKIMTVYPQVMVNIEATPEMKERLNDAEVKSYLDIETGRLEGDGRILVRPSGTEPLIRIMIEGKDKEKINALVLECAETLKNLIS
ncbi:MAG: phosphoglucosamine mutase, partial [Oscillospiraceae bacterium]|nr:phosphoglucosamine mutase [Oscillospiraceae bacterium]